MPRRFRRRASLALAGSLLFSTPVLAQGHPAPFPRDGAQLVIENEHVEILNFDKDTDEKRKFPIVVVVVGVDPGRGPDSVRLR